MSLKANSAQIPWWTVTSSTINEIVWGKTLTCDGHTAAAGTYFVDLTGYGSDSPNGAVQQTLNNLTTGHGYNVSLDVIDDNLPPLVTVDGAGVTLTKGSTITKGSDVWTIYKGSFTAQSANPVLTIQNQGVQLEFVDNVVVTAK